MKKNLLYASSLWASFTLREIAAQANDSSIGNDDPTWPLSRDGEFSFQILAPLGLSIYGGADIAPLLGVAKDVKAGDMADFSDKFQALANHTKFQAQTVEHDPVNARETWFAAATYYRIADFFLHGNWSNPLIDSLWIEQTAAFDKAIAALPVPGQRLHISASDGSFIVEAIWYAASADNSTKRPTLIVGNGYDAAQEDSYHTFCNPALARGWNCLTYEGPGQPTVRRNQNIGFIPDWERVLTPVVDYLLSEQADAVDEARLALVGFSLGGYLAARAAAFEPRLSAVLLDGGVWDVHEAFTAQLTPDLLKLYTSGNKSAFDDVVISAREAGEFPTTLAWAIDQGLWTFVTHSPYEFLAKTKQFTLESVVNKIKAPVWIADAEFEGFFVGQASKVKAALAERAEFHLFTGVAGYHCQVGAAQELTRTMFAWLNKTLKIQIYRG